MSAAIQVVELNPVYRQVTEGLLQETYSLLIAAEIPAEEVLTLMALLNDEEQAGKYWLMHLPRPVIREQIAGPELLGNLDQLALAGERPVLVLLYEDMAAKPVCTMAAGITSASTGGAP